MFDINQSPYDDDGEVDDDAMERYLEELTSAFADSPEGQACVAEQGQLGWSRCFLEFGFSYRGETPPEMSRYSVEEIVFKIIPRKVSTSPDSAAVIVGELRAFWQFLQREYGLGNAKKILQEFEPPAEKRLRKALDTPSNFGMAKSFVTMGQEAGYDMTTQEGMNEFMQVYNARMIAQRAERAEQMAAREPQPPNRIDPPAMPTAPRPKRTLDVGHVSPDQRRERNKRLRQLKGKKRK